MSKRERKAFLELKTKTGAPTSAMLRIAAQLFIKRFENDPKAIEQLWLELRKRDEADKARIASPRKLSSGKQASLKSGLEIAEEIRRANADPGKREQ